MRSRTVGLFTAFFSIVATSGVVAGLDAASVEPTDESQRAAQSRQLVVRGHGYGHGHGMSQYGAEGAARRGKSYRQIVNFYYPGTSWARLKGRIRVLITADTTPEVVVSPTAGLTVRDRANGRLYRLPRSRDIDRWRLSPRRGSTVIEQLTGDQWRRYRPGGRSDGALGGLDGVGEFFADGPLTLWLPNGSTKRYRGALRAAPPTTDAGTFDTVNALSMDDYLQGVVPYEMPASWHTEAVKSQAIAARTYATWSRNQNRSRHYQICDTTSCQVYGGVNGEDSRSNAAVVATTRQILTFKGQAAFTQFSSSSGGWTANGGVPYLPAQKDPYDGWSGNSMHSWSTTISASAAERKYPRLGTLRGIRVLGRDGSGAWGGRVTRVLLDGSRSDVRLSGDGFRWAFGLRSNWFKIG
ncbi:MAG TPA: SpoIID/LytB domain-containing protein [Nocardioidaceae bacterium]|nr:SpoIID/LytB domain-containing protein [Nocardioidaceae bacterium]